jgi:beta-lactamase class C
MRFTAAALIMAAFCIVSASAGNAADQQSRIERAVDATIQPLMAKDGIAGMAVGVTLDGKPYVFDYGVASRSSRQPVTGKTLFELGSISKTFTATLAAYAQVLGYLSLADRTSTYLPALRGTSFGDVSLLELGTHTPGGLPLQVPANVHNDDELMAYFKGWRPIYPPGTYRTYSNVGIGTLGLITATSMHQNFTTLMERRLFPAFGLESSYINVPPAAMADYAQGYTAQGAPIRVAPGVLSAEAYGIKATAGDVLRFVAANVNAVAVDEKLERAIAVTQTGYFRAGVLTQDLIWEQYAYPVALQTLLAGNSPAMLFDATPASALRPPQRPRPDVWIDKTGTTNGFGAYVAFVPKERFGIVLLANKNYPISERVTAAFQVAGLILNGQ